MKLTSEVFETMKVISPKRFRDMTLIEAEHNINKAIEIEEKIGDVDIDYVLTTDEKEIFAVYLDYKNAIMEFDDDDTFDFGDEEE